VGDGTASATVGVRPRVASRPADDEPPAQVRPLGLPPPLHAPGRATALPPRPDDRLRGWVVAVLLALAGGVVRFANLGFPTDAGTPVFDEKHYVPQAWQMLRNGGVEDNPGYALVVHPPLGKQLIALGELVFGYDGFGWRAASALAGTLCILLIVRIARRLTGSTLLAGIAGVLLIVDGLSHVQTRMGMLDSFAALFVLAAFATLLCDRDDVRARMALVVAEGRVGESPYGPRLGVRWWRFATGVLLGLSCAVKWSGAYWVIAFGVLTIAWDVTARRSAGVQRPFAGMVVRDLGPAVWALGVAPVLVYLSSWWAWFGSETAIERHVAGDAFLSLLHYTRDVLAFHEGLTTQASGQHEWESKPWTWPMALRPMLYYYASGPDVTGCEAPECVSAVMLVGPPALWWPALPVLAFGLWRALTRRDWRWAAVLTGYAAGVLPWLANVDRQMYLFYMTPVAPFLVLAIVLTMGAILGRGERGRRQPPSERRRTGLLVVALWVGLAVANFAWLWPILTGVPITHEAWDAQLWLPSWRP
jgi:dolichyl-phosphate-mannose--protein O-mannosyl transferase